MSKIDTSPAALRALADDWMCDDAGYHAREQIEQLQSALRAVAAEKKAQAGFCLVPKRLSRAMEQVMEEEDWAWESLLAAAEVISEEEHEEIAAAPHAPSPQQERALQTLSDVDAEILAAAPQPQERFDLATHLCRQREFSLRTFGPGARVQGVTDHIAKELIEVRDSGGALAEWIDVIILGFDGAIRSGADATEIIEAMVAKQTRNEGRSWPDWRTSDPNKAIEHDRSGEVLSEVPARPGEPSPTPTLDRTEAEQRAKDRERMNWLSHAGDVSFGLVVDAPHDGEIEIYCSESGSSTYAPTLRAAIDAAMAQERKGGQA